MLIQFEKLPDQARVWVYQLSRQLTPAEQEMVEQAMTDFCSRWQAHGRDLACSYKVEYGQFLVLAVDEESYNASGCSIDASVHTLKQLEEALNVKFFDRLNAAFLIGGQVQLMNLAIVKEKLAAGEMSGHTLTFNNLVASKGALANEWIIPVKDSWLARHLPKGALA